MFPSPVPQGDCRLEQQGAGTDGREISGGASEAALQLGSPYLSGKERLAPNPLTDMEVTGSSFCLAQAVPLLPAPHGLHLGSELDGWGSFHSRARNET